MSSKFAPFATNLQVQVLSCAKHRKASVDDDKENWWPFTPADEEATVETKFDKRDDDDDDDNGDGDSGGDSDGDSNGDSDGDSDSDSDDDDEKKPETSDKGRFVRIILNDAPVPLTGIRGCKKDRDGLCAIDAFVSSMHTLIGETDFARACHDDYDFEAEVMDGQPL